MGEVLSFRDYVDDERLRFITMDPHGETNEDGSRRGHCCGCWVVFIDPLDPFKVTAECNECGEIRTARIGGVEP